MLNVISRCFWPPQGPTTQARVLLWKSSIQTALLHRLRTTARASASTQPADEFWCRANAVSLHRAIFWSVPANNCARHSGMFLPWSKRPV